MLSFRSCLAAALLLAALASGVMGCGQASSPDATPADTTLADTTTASAPRDTVPDTAQVADTLAAATGADTTVTGDDASEEDAAGGDASGADATGADAAVSDERLEAVLAALEREVAESRAVRDSLRSLLAAADEPSVAGTGEAPPDTARPAATPPEAPADPDRGDAGGDRLTLEEARDTARSFGLRAAFAVLVLVLTFFAIKGVAYVLETLSERSAERRLLYKRVVPIARVIMWAVALYVVLRGIFEVDAQGLLAAAAAIGVAVGFAAQDLLKNIFGGLVIIFDTPFQVGDKISVGGTYGEVIGIGLRSTRIVTPDDNLVSVPNSQIVDGQVSNANAGALDCQVVTDLYLPGWVDEAKAKQIAYEAAASSKYVYLQKPIAVIVKDEYDDGHTLHLKVKAYVLDTRYEFLLASDVTERARRAFRREGLLVPATRAFVDLPYRTSNGDGPKTGETAADTGDGASGAAP